MFKKITSGLLVIAMIMSLAVPVFATENADPKNQTFIDVKPVEFKKTGTVRTIVNHYDSEFYLVTEYFDTKGEYYAPKVEKSITQEEFEKYYKGKSFDLMDIRIIVNNGDNALFMNVILDVNENIVNSSYAGTLIDGNFSPVSVDTKEEYRWVLDINGKYYSVSTTGTKSVYSVITDLEYQQILFNRDYMYSKVVSDIEDNGQTIHKEIMYDTTDSVIGAPTIIQKDSNINIAEVFFIINALTQMSENNESVVYGLDVIASKLNDFKAPNDGVIGDEEEEEEDTYTIDGDMLEKYQGIYSNWMDRWNKGYLGSWMDPYFKGDMQVIDWEDPFWTQSDINHTLNVDGIASGYYDDAGNYIPTDASGNPIPSESGKFDSAGNFMPSDSSGYYDPDGIYHPLFQVIAGIRYDFNGRFYIDNYGYFDGDGIWHPKNNDENTIILFDGRIVHKNGYIENPLTGVKLPIEMDIWGKYYFNDEVIYEDYSVYNKKDNTLTLPDGTVYDGKTEEYFIQFANNDVVMKGTFEKGKKTVSSTLLPNEANITDNGIIQYVNGISYSELDGVHLPNGEILNETFLDKEYIDVGDFGRIYPNGHIARLNEYGDLITDTDAIIYEDRVLLANGDIYKEGKIYQTYRDRNGNIVCTDGTVINKDLKLGYYGEAGGFIEGVSSYTDGYFDRVGNFIYFDGVVKHLNDTGYYNVNGTFVSGVDTDLSFYYTVDGAKIYKDNTVISDEAVYGYYDKNGNFVMNDGGGFFDADGTFSQTSNDKYYIVNSNGLFYNALNPKFTLNVDGNISVMGEKGTYDENGMVTLNGTVGYYDETGMFVISKENPYIQFGYFYDSLQNKHSRGTIYRDANGVLRLLQNPIFGLSVSGNTIKIANGDSSYDLSGLTTVDGKTGYYTATGKFVESVVSPYKGGFYDKNGFWIDKTYYTNPQGEITLNYGGFNYMGNFVTPSGDIGSFDKSGIFNINKTNKLENGFYDQNGKICDASTFYIDEFGYYKNTNGNEMYGVNGDMISLSESIGMKMEDYVMIEYGMFISTDGTIGHFDSNGKFLEGRPTYQEGFYTPSGGFVKFGTSQQATYSGNFVYILNKYYVVFTDESNQTGILNMPDGYAVNVNIINGKYFELSDGTIITDVGEVGRLDGDTFKAGNEVTGLSDSDVNVIPTIDGAFIDKKDNFGYFMKDGTFVLYDGTYGYYDAKGRLVPNALNPYSNGFYNFEGKWKQTDTTFDVPNKGYFNRYGIRRNGENPYNSGFYDYEGSLHLFNRDYIITTDGNIVQMGDNAIGYIDSLGNLHISEHDGYFDADGNYYIGTVLQGHYNSDGLLLKGKNNSFDGFYDMLGNWHLFGDKGYYDVHGYYYEDVTDSEIGYFNEVGEFTIGYNPYVNGYNDANGNWSNTFTMPLTTYYLEDGTARIGTNPDKLGYYDMYGNWHRYGDKGYFDKHGTYYSVSTNSKGYYDAVGNYREGTNPYQHGYYDEDGNLKLFHHPGYFTKDGTFVDDKGNWYYLEGGLKKRGTNAYTEGFYDKYGNWYPFDEDGYYTPEGLFFPTLLVVDKYRVGSDNYILFEGIFTNPEFVPSSSKNTIQFTFNGESGAPLYVDTGIRVSKNAMISYSNARDLLHNISVYSKSTFIEDNNSCIVIIDGKIINLTNNGKMSIEELRNKFLDSNIHITVGKTRIGHKFALVDSIEAGKDIKVEYNGVKYNINNPMVVYNSAPYISLKDISDIIVYNAKVESGENRKAITFTLKDSVSDGLRAQLSAEISMVIGNTECLINLGNNEYVYYILKAPVITRANETTGLEEVYIPVYLLGNLTGTYAEYNTKDYKIELTTLDNELPFEDD